MSADDERAGAGALTYAEFMQLNDEDRAALDDGRAEPIDVVRELARRKIAAANERVEDVRETAAAKLHAEIDRLTGERDAEAAMREALVQSLREANAAYIGATERAEAAERELADLRRRVFRGDFLTIGLTPEDTAARLGRTDLYRAEDDK